MIPLAAGWGTTQLARRRGWGTPAVVGALAALTVLAPPAGLAGAAITVAAFRWRRAAAITAGRRAVEADVATFVDLVVLGLGAGLSVRAAFETAARHVHPDLAEEVDGLVATMDRSGVGPALSVAEGHLAGVGRVVAAAAVSGAPPATALAAYARSLRHAQHAAAVERARRLPVRLLLPLALLILPGFVVLAVGPAVLQSLARLGPIP